MARKTPETVLISALVNSQDPQLAEKLGLRPEHFDGYRQEYEWLLSYSHRFGKLPSPVALTTKYSHIPYWENQDDPEWAAEEVIQAYAKRNLTKTVADALDLLDRDQITEAYDLMGIPSPMSSARPIDALADDSIFEDYGSERDVIQMPWSSMQDATDGMDLGELWYCAARPSKGKSAIQLYIAAKAALQGRRVMYYSLEMTNRQVQERLFTILAAELGIEGVTHTALRRRSYNLLDYRELQARIRETVPGLIHVHTPSEGTCTPSVVAARAADYDLNIVDYMGLMKASTGLPSIADWRVLAQISNELKQVALAHKTRILAASQINRDGDRDTREERRMPPKLKNLAGSDALAQDGDVVVTMNRYSKDSLILSMEKNRHGNSGFNWYAKFDPDNGRFEEIDRSDAEGYEEVYD